MSSPPNYSQVLDCTYGAAGLSLLSVEVRQEPVVKEGLGRVATNVTIKAECELRKQTPADLDAALAVVLPLLAVDGLDFVVKGLGGFVQFQLLASESANYGPHVGYVMKDSPEAPLCKLFTLQVTSQSNWPSGNPAQVNDTFKLHVDTRPDGLITVTRSGEMHGFNTPTFFTDVVLPAFKKSYALPKWVVSYSYDTSQDVPRAGGGTSFIQQNKLTYQVIARQNIGALPSTAAGATVAGVAVDGEVTTKVDRDEQHRKTTTIDFDLLVVGSVSALMSAVRPGKPGVVIYRESLSVTGVREQRVRGNFTMLESADGDKAPLLNYQQTVRFVPGDKAYDVKEYNGAAPVVVAKAQTMPRITQTGSCRAVGRWRKAPTPIFHTHLELPERAYTFVDDVQMETTWTYVMYPCAPGGGTLGNSDDTPAPTYGDADDFDVSVIGRSALGIAPDRFLPPVVTP